MASRTTRARGKPTSVKWMTCAATGRALSATEITQAFNGALVDTNALIMQLDFAAAPGAGITLTWQCLDAILQSADSVNGPYTDVPGAVSPYSIGMPNTAKFFRYRGHTPVVVVANPYLM